jgi:hypothetical protein
MVEPRQSRFVQFTDWVGVNIFSICLTSLGVAVFGALAPLRLNPLLALAGLILFLIAALIHGRAFVMREMKTAQELGFKRNRDYFLYAGSPAGMDWRVSSLAVCALPLAFVIGSGAIGRATGGGALLAFSVFVLAGAVARLRRKWPVDNHSAPSA